MATVVKATEQVLVETATAVVSSLGTAATAEFKTLESGIAQEAVSATDDDVSNIIQKVEGAVEVVVEEVVNGAEHVVEAVKQHPELIAEGALAVAIGVASLVQPELIAGEVAILGKMAADSAKKTVTKIASDEGEKIVKAISKDLTEDAKAEAEKDKLQAEEKKKTEGGEVVVDGEAPKAPEGTEAKPVAEGEKTISIEIQKPAVKTEEGAKDVTIEKDPAPVELKITIGSDGEIKAVSKSVVEETKPVEKQAEEKNVDPVVAEKEGAPVLAKTEVPVSHETTAPVAEKSLDLPKEVPVPAEPEKSIPTTEPKPVEVQEALLATPESVLSQPEPLLASIPVVKEVSIPITQEVIPAKSEALPDKDVPVPKEPLKEEIKATELPVVTEPVKTETKVEALPSPVEKTVDVPKTSEDAPVTSTLSETKDIVQPEIMSVLGITHSEVVEEPPTAQVLEEKKEALPPKPEKAESFVESLLHRSNSGEPLVPAVKEDEETVSIPQLASVEPVEVKQDPEVVASVTEDLTKEEHAAVPVQASEIITQEEPAQPEQVPTVTEPKLTATTEQALQVAPEAKSTSPEPSQTPPEDNENPVPSAISQAKNLAVSALESSSAEAGPALITAAASVTNITTTTTKTIELPSSPAVPMVTVSQESLDILHSKLDAMHEAIQLITKTLATHLPAPAASAPAPAAPLVVEEVEVESIPAPIAQVVSEQVAQEPETPIQVQSTSTTTSDEITPAPTTSTSVPTSTTSTETLPTSSQSATPKRPTHVKRGSVIGSIGKFLWPFGGSVPPPKDAAVKVSTVEVSGEVEAPSSKSSSKDSAPGPELTKAVSTVEVTEVLATPVAV